MNIGVTHDILLVEIWKKKRHLEVMVGILIWKNMLTRRKKEVVAVLEGIIHSTIKLTYERYHYLNNISWSLS